jgi:hypothetical protein
VDIEMLDLPYESAPWTDEDESVETEE